MNKNTTTHPSPLRCSVASTSARIQSLAGRSLRRLAQTASLCATALLFSGVAVSSVKAATGTLNSLSADAEACSNGTVVSTGSFATLGGISGVQRCLVNVFQIPSAILSDPTQQFSAATYTVKTAYMASWPFNGDLYGIGYSTTSSAVAASDYYEGALDSANTLIQDNFITGAIPSYTAVSSTNAALVNYLNAQLTAARADGASSAYVFFRINPDAYIYWNSYQIGMTEAGGGYVPTLGYTTVSVPLWRNVVIGGGGWVTGLAASTTGAAIYARTDVGGAYRWDSANTKWIPITDSLPNDSSNNGPTYGIGSIAVDPNNANRVFISAGKYNYSNPSGIYTCSDTSASSPTWTVVDSTIRLNGNGGLRQTGERLAVDPYNSNVVYYGTDNVSVAGGQGLKKFYYDTAWHSSTLTTPAIGDANAGITFVAADKNGGTVIDSGTRTVAKYIYIGVYSGSTGSGGVFASSNGGASWTKATGAVVDKPYRGVIGSDGTLYVSYTSGVVKLARGATALTSISPVASIAYGGLAADPSVAGTVMVGEYGGSNRLWRSLNSGSTWVLMTRTIHNNEPDGTASVTGKGAFTSLASLMINPANLDEVWASDMLGVQRTQNIQDTTAGSDWYMVQKGHEEVCPLDLRSKPTGSRLLSGVADVNGFVHNDPTVRPVPADRFDSPNYLSTTSLDYSAGTSGSTTVWARVGDLYYGSENKGGISTNDGQSWVTFGQLDGKSVTNGTAGGWETFDVGPYLKQLKATSGTSVTLCVFSSHWSSQSYLRFSSKEGANPPQIIVNGTSALTLLADATVSKSGSNSNYATSPELQSSNYYDQANYTRRAYLKFDLTSVSSISTATLRLYRMPAPGTDTTSYPTFINASPTNSWGETTITWNNMPVDYLTPPSGAQGGRVAVSTSDPAKLVWVPENGYVYYSKNRGATWARGTLSGANLTVNTCSEFEVTKSHLTVDRVAADTFYVFAATGTIYRSTDGGVTWAVMASGLGSVSTGYNSGFKLESVPGMSGKVWLCTADTNYPNYFKYWNGTSMVAVPNITSVADFAFGKAKAGNTNPTVYVRKADGTYWYSTDATAGATFTWTQISVPKLNDQPWIMEGDQQQYGRFYVGTNGRGIFFADAP